MKPLNPKVQNYYTQTGIENDVTFMWKYGVGNHFQTAYKIDIFYNDSLRTDKGTVLSSCSAFFNSIFAYPCNSAYLSD